MKRLALSFALVFAVPAMAVAATTSVGIHRGTLRHHHPMIHRTVAETQVMPPMRPTVFSSAQRVPHRVYEIEGLTRNPSACVVYGCIGNN